MNQPYAYIDFSWFKSRLKYSYFSRMPRTTPVTMRRGWSILRNWQPHLALVIAQSITGSQRVLEAGLTGSTNYSPKEWVCNWVHWGDTLSTGDTLLFLGGGADHGPSWPRSKRAWRPNSIRLSVKGQTQLTVGVWSFRCDVRPPIQGTKCNSRHGSWKPPGSGRVSVDCLAVDGSWMQTARQGLHSKCRPTGGGWVARVLDTNTKSPGCQAGDPLWKVRLPRKQILKWRVVERTFIGRCSSDQHLWGKRRKQVGADSGLGSNAVPKPQLVHQFQHMRLSGLT